MRRAGIVCLLFAWAAACTFAFSNLIGFRVGATAGWASGDDWDLAMDSVDATFDLTGVPVTVDNNAGVGFTAALFLDLRASRVFGVQIEAAYDHYSAAMRIENDANSDDWVRLIERYQVLEIPVLIKLRLDRSLAVFGGAVGVLRFGDLIEIADGPHDWDKTTVPADGYADMMYGAVLGIELATTVGRMGAMGVLDIRYVHMLSAVTDLNAPATNDFFLRGVSISAGIGFPVGAERR